MHIPLRIEKIALDDFLRAGACSVPSMFLASGPIGTGMLRAQNAHVGATHGNEPLNPAEKNQTMSIDKTKRFAWAVLAHTFSKSNVASRGRCNTGNAWPETCRVNFACASSHKAAVEE